MSLLMVVEKPRCAVWMLLLLPAGPFLLPREEFSLRGPCCATQPQDALSSAATSQAAVWVSLPFLCTPLWLFELHWPPASQVFVKN